MTMANNFTICNSRLNKSKQTFIWTIEHFSERKQKMGECLESGILTSITPSGSPVKWRLDIYPNGDREEANDFVSIYIHLIDCATYQVSATIHYWIRDSKGVNRLKRGGSNCDIYANNQSSRGFPRFIKRDVLFNEANRSLLPGDRLTIVCEVIVQEESMESSKIDDFNIPECHIGEQIGNLFDNGNKFADCTLQAIEEGKEFKVYKGILACRSPVFAAMFEHPLAETNEGVVKIKEIKSEVLEQMLRFIYSGEAPKLGEMAEDLLEAADKYQLDQLKVLCENSLVHSLWNENACALLVLADSHSAGHLKVQAFKFIREHPKEVMESEGWKQMLANGKHAELIGELFKEFAAIK